MLTRHNCHWHWMLADCSSVYQKHWKWHCPTYVCIYHKCSLGTTVTEIWYWQTALLFTKALQMALPYICVYHKCSLGTTVTDIWYWQTALLFTKALQMALVILATVNWHLHYTLLFWHCHLHCLWPFCTLANEPLLLTPGAGHAIRYYCSWAHNVLGFPRQRDNVLLTKR